MFVLTAENFKGARITLFLISINIVFFIAFTFAMDQNFFLLFVQINYKIIYYYEYWRLITAIFLHNDILHIISNMFGLLLFGAFIESYFSKISYILLYIISGLIGNLFSLIFLPSDVISLGASGCIFGLIGATFLIIVMQKDRILLLIGIVYIIYFIITSFSPGINYIAHIFGLLGGITFSFFFLMKKQVKDN